MEMTDKKKISEEPSLQLELWGNYLTNDISEVSNTLEIWDTIPKYFLSEKAVKGLRNKDGLSKPFKWKYTHNKIGYQVVIQPALIEVKKDQYRAFFPSVTEERVEDALRKILTDQNLIFHDVERIETWIKFTLKGLQKELKSRKTSRSIDEIKRSIEVLNKCVLTVYKEGKEIWSGSILQDLVTVNREEYLADSNSYHAAKLPVFISHSINSLDYRQFNYDRLMRCKDQLSRWMLRRFVHRFTYASVMNTYNFMYSSLKASGLLQMGRETDNRKKVIKALDDHVNTGVLLSYIAEEQREGRTISDVKYTVTPTPGFSSEQKAANKRINDNETKAFQSGHPELKKVLIQKTNKLKEQRKNKR